MGISLRLWLVGLIAILLRLLKLLEGGSLLSGSFSSLLSSSELVFVLFCNCNDVNLAVGSEFLHAFCVFGSDFVGEGDYLVNKILSLSLIGTSINVNETVDTSYVATEFFGGELCFLGCNLSHKCFCLGSILSGYSLYKC